VEACHQSRRSTTVISNSNIEQQKLKTKIRRLYDIANVLQSIGLIQKTNTENKKQAFEWVGIEGVI